MPKVDRTAERPTHSKLDQSAVKLLLQNDVAASSAGSVLERFLLVAFLITVFILISVYFKVYDVKQPMVPEADDVVQIRTVYSGVNINEGDIYFLNRHEARRRRSASRVRSRPNGVSGLAIDCGNSCYFRLRQHFGRSNNTELRIHLCRWSQLPQSNNQHRQRKHSRPEIRPLVQYVDASAALNARVSRVAPSCIYSAHVNGLAESSIVNLCDSNGGMFGTLALPDGTYIIEPIESQYLNGSRKPSSSGSRKAHLVYKARPLSFHSYDYSAVSDQEAVFDALLVEADQNTTYQTPLDNEESISFVQINGKNSSYKTYLSSEYRRLRRSANSWDHYVEVLAVADYSMYMYHQNNLENYLLTLFSTASSIYRHPSLNAAINVVLVKITVLKQRMPEFEGQVARDILSAFCRWQKYINDPNEESVNHHDVALFLTRNDLCRNPGQCDTLGLAELGMMCEPEKSCAIIEDNGLSTGFTITHELGHIFNLPHDQDEPCSKYTLNQRSNFHIMAKTVRYDTHPWSWSPCSAAVLSRFLDMKRYRTQCLLDAPVEKRYYERALEMPPPGVMFSADQQCKFLFGSRARHCTLEAALMENETCTRLWCEGYFVNGRGVITNGCRTHYLPWADGTPCGSSKWCHQGKCVGLAPQQRHKQDGQWGEWAPWGECSRTCGGGIQAAFRKCDNPSPNGGGKYCIGQRGRYRSCAIIECPIDTPGFREVQCSSYNFKNTGLHGVPKNVRWTPRYDGVSQNERCKLYCHPEGKSAFYLLNSKVVDGTPCDRNTDDICIDGTCHKAGCNHRLGSDIHRDRCGVCGGNNSSCRLVTGTYNQRGQHGYTEVVKIPSGSSAIEIKQRGYKNRKDDDTYLALRNSKNEYIINGNYQVSVYPIQVTVQKAVFWYSGSDNIVESINCSGPIRSDIFLHVLSVGRLYAPDISYQYMLPISTNGQNAQKTDTSMYYWRTEETWSECSAVCQGQQSQLLTCTDKSNSREVPKNLCTLTPPATKTKMCNVDCIVKWRTVNVGACSVTCGHGEIRQKSECVRHFNDGREEAIAEIECRNQKKPADRKTCYYDCSGRKWSYSEWTQCSETCGNGGIMKRQVFCVDQENRKIEEKLCERTEKEAVEMECNRIPCPKWMYTAWSECSRSCGGGVRVRHASCQDATGRDVNIKMCNAKEKHDREVCNEHLCTHWQFAAWSTCSVTCGDGTQIRDAVCVDHKGRHLDGGRCNPQHRHVIKQCHLPPCPRWRLGNWSPCSATCSDGWRRRLVSCVDNKGNEISSEQCLSRSEVKPQAHEKCNLGSCPIWRSSNWSQCSVSCGTGIKSRRVDCMQDEKIVDRKLCDERNKPNTEEVCRMNNCGRWESTGWSRCSVSCGVGVQKRVVRCIQDGAIRSKTVMHEGQCDPKMRPPAEKPCQQDVCKNYYNSKENGGSWETTAWSECSKTCGVGVQSRQVKCRHNNRDVSNESCKIRSRPANVQQCQLKSCGKWVVGSWKPCPKTCGTSVITERLVLCQSSSQNTFLRDSECDAATKPSFRRTCNLSPCPSSSVISKTTYNSFGKWITGNWGQCSTTCGLGWRRRSVTCSQRNCDEKMKPKFYEQCNLRTCSSVSPHFRSRWRTAAWSRCSVTCGGGIQQRDVWCENIRTKLRLLDVECASFRKPENTRRCALMYCASVTSARYRWNTGRPSSSSSMRSSAADQRDQMHYHIKKRRRYRT